MKKIALTKGYYALVDDSMFDELKKYKWHVSHTDRKTIYAMRSDGPQNPAVYMHRQIMKPPKGLFVDHINRNGLDNRTHNLRICTKTENCRNVGMRAHNKTGTKGVYYLDRTWRAQIQVNYKRISKRFKTKEEAMDQYRKWEKEFFGEFACIDEPEEGK